MQKLTIGKLPIENKGYFYLHKMCICKFSSVADLSYEPQMLVTKSVIEKRDHDYISLTKFANFKYTVST